MILGRHPADAIVFHIDGPFRHLQGIAGGQPAGAVGFDYLAVDAAGQHVAAKLTADAAADNRDQLALTGLRAAGDNYRFINLDGNGKTVSEFGGHYGSPVSVGNGTRPLRQCNGFARDKITQGLDENDWLG